MAMFERARALCWGAWVVVHDPHKLGPVLLAGAIEGAAFDAAAPAAPAAP
jgi:hypothetical protein